MVNRLTLGSGLLLPGLLSAFIAITAMTVTGQDKKSKENEKSMAIYADAANFLNAGKYELSIEEWGKFLKDYPKDPLAGKAAHYLGVSLMQKEKPDYVSAAKQFDKALDFKGFDMREEALANRAWCLYTAGRNEALNVSLRNEFLNAGVQTYSFLLKEFPQTKHAPQALFFSGEAEYVMEHRDKAIEFYRKLLQNAPKDSPLRCDAMYAEGVAKEELGQAKEALQVYAELLEACADGPLVGEVMIRRGELLAKQNQHAEAIAQFQKAVKAGGDLADYAQYRYAASLLLAGKTDDAAQAYLELVQKFPNSQYVNSAKMASAQSFFQAEKFDKAGPMFQFLLKTDDPATVIEAAHWLAQIALRQNKPADVMPLAEQTLAKHKNQAPYRDSLQLDIADALVALNKPPEALKAFAAVYEHASDKNLVGRSLYGAAFTALQSKDSQTALTLANRFLKQFPNDALTPDAAYVAAEAMLQASNFEASQKAYDELLKQVKDHPNRGIWELRAITAAYLGGKYDAASERARQALNSLKTDREKAEANYLLGGSELLAGRPDKAIPPLTAAASAKGVFPQVDESILLLGQAQANAKDSASAKKTWQKLVAEYPNTSLAEQGHYRLGQLLASEKEFAGAEQHYDAVLKGGKNEPLRPYSLYGKGWSLMQLQKYEPAIEPLDKVLKDFPEHAVKNDALLARGISLHHLKRNDDATKDLEKFLASKPMGHELGHALYELALIDLESKRPAEAVKRLRQIVDQVPDYPSADKVLYELAWTAKDAGQEAVAAKSFDELIGKYPKSSFVAEASYHVGQYHYGESRWTDAVKYFQRAEDTAADKELKEKSLYKLGWADFQSGQYEQASKTFERQLKEFAGGGLALDARMMVGECQFKREKYSEALAAFREARQTMEKNSDKKDIDPQEQQVRELVLLHGGQCEQQLDHWKDALSWFTALRERYANTQYLAQVFYETGFCHQNLNQPDEAVKYYGQVAENYRTEVAARARFMIGEIYFGQREPAKAIPEFQRVMLGFGADKAPEDIKNWQGKAAYEAGRCAELLIEQAAGDARKRAVEISHEFYQHLVDKHPQHELVGKARERLDVLKKL